MSLVPRCLQFRNLMGGGLLHIRASVTVLTHSISPACNTRHIPGWKRLWTLSAGRRRNSFIPCVVVARRFCSLLDAGVATSLGEARDFTGA
jgi:hypothetical protein